MTFIPTDELKDQGGVTLAPMIDFLFLMLAVFASLAVSRIVIKDTEIELVQSKSEVESPLGEHSEYKIVNICVAKDGGYTWVTEIRDYPLPTAGAIAQELLTQYDRGLLPDDKLQTQVLLKIDKEAQWESILEAMLAIREAGFEIRPVYEPESA